MKIYYQKLISLIVVLIIAFVSSPTVGQEIQKGLAIFDVVTDKLKIDYSNGDVVKIMFKLSIPSSTTIGIYNIEDSEPVLVLESNHPRQAGFNTVTWNGKDQSGAPVTSGVYRYTIQAKSGKSTFTYDPAPATRGKQVTVKELDYDPHRGQISFVLGEPAWVRIRMIRKNKMLVSTPWQWKPMDAGKKILHWDGWDNNHSRKYVGDLTMKIGFSGMVLPKNGLIVKGLPANKHVWNNLPISFDRYKSEEGFLMHARHHMGMCYDPPINIYIAGNKIKTTEDGTPIVTGRVPVKVDMPTDQPSAFRDSCFLTRYFIDDAFLSEDMRSVLPQTYMLDTSSISRGVHVITVNCLDFFGHAGVASLKLQIEPNSNKRGK